MKKLLLLLLLPFLSYGQVQIGDDIDGEAAGDEFGTSVSFSSDGTILAVGARFNDGNGNESGHVRVFENQGDNWIQIGNDIDAEAEFNQFGTSVSLSSDGNIIAIGAKSNDGNGSGSGHVRVFENQSDSWIQIGNDIDGEASSDQFGTSVSLSSDGTILAVGAAFNDGNGINSGHVRVFENQNSSWIQLGNDIDGEAMLNFFGWSVSLSSDGGILAAGAPSNNDNGSISGQVGVFENQNGSWVPIGNDINGVASNNDFGSSVSLSSDGSILAVGAYRNDDNGVNSGHVRVFENQSGSWIQIGNDINGESSGDQAGISISLSNNGTLLAIGASGHNGNGENSGHVRIFQNQNGNWIQIGNNINGEALGDFSGSRISLSANGTTVAIGAITNDGNGENSGHVRVFDLSDILSAQETFITRFSLYPNPTKNNLTINLSGSDTLQKATIYNSLGQEVLNSTEQIIDVSSLSKGVYVVEVQTSTGKGSEKLIIN